MRPQLQRFRHAESEGFFGDCHRTCIAMIFDLDRDEVPHFMDGVPADAEADSPECQAAEQAECAWLAERGLVPVYWGYEGSSSLDEVLQVLGNTVKGTAVILGCTSGNGYNHSVVYYNGRLYNPAGSAGVIAGPMRNGYWYVTAFAHATKPIADPIDREDQPYIEQLSLAAEPASVVTQED